MEFFVADAERLFAQGGKVKNFSFWGYKIMTRSALPSFQNPPLFQRVVQGPPTNAIAGDGYVDYCTWHRYSDFEWFAAQLSHQFPGIVFPPIPDKDADGTKDKLQDLVSGVDSIDSSRDNDLVQYRIRHLQLFFDQLVLIKELHESEVLRAFTTMEEPEWLAYKERTIVAQKGKGWEALKSKGLGLISRLGSIGDKKPVAFPDGHPVADIKTKMINMNGSVRACAMHMLFLRKYGHYAPTLQVESGDDVKAGDVGTAPNSQVLPPTLVYNGHFVCEINNRQKQGVVRHVEGPSAWVDWADGAPLARIPVSQLCYPPSGISDPAIFAAKEIASQVDSFCTNLGMRAEARQLERLTDLLYFWAKACAQVVAVIDQLQESLEELTLVEKDFGKMKEGAEKAATGAKLTNLKQRFESGVRTLQEQSYPAFRHNLRRALLDIAHLFGSVSVTFLCDDEWESRLQRADVALPLLFEPPQEAIDTLTEEAKSAQFVEYSQQQQPQPQSTTWVAQAAPPPQQAPPQPQYGYQQQQPQTYPVPPSPATPPSPTPSPYTPSPQITATAPPDDTPPELPPAAAAQHNDHDVQSRTDRSTSGFEATFQAKPTSRSWEPEAETSSTEPPPPPSHDA